MPSDGEAELVQGNPDEIMLEEDDEDVGFADTVQKKAANVNPEEIGIEDDFDDPASAPIPTTNGQSQASETEQATQIDESADLVEAARKTEGMSTAQGVLGVSTKLAPPTADIGKDKSGQVTKFLALDKCGRGKDFIQVISTLN